MNFPTEEFPAEEFLKLSRQLEKHHAVFNKLWNLGTPKFTSEIPTACVKFNKFGDCIDFLINRDFWKTQSDIQKQFIICHESLHVILNHGLRTLHNIKDYILTNRTLDIVVNHNLINRFNFDRSLVDPDNKYCWIDTVFTTINNSNIPDNKSFEYYYNLLLSQPQNTTAKILDCHDYFSGDASKFIKRLNGELSNFDKFSLKDLINNHSEKNENPDGRSENENGSWSFVNPYLIKKNKWESVIKDWSVFAQNKDKEIDQWIKINRRLANFKNNNLQLPSSLEEECLEKNKINVWFFQDTSGSCQKYTDRFFSAAMSLPKNRFIVKVFCFDTKVYPTTLESKKVYGSGGTAFSCIENYIQKTIKEENLKYPDSVWVITDGAGDKVYPEKPEKWYWFLSGSYADCIPKECNLYMLKDFE